MLGKIILNLAMSIDGYIANNDGSFDWINGDGCSDLNTEFKSDFNLFLESIDVVLMGSDCYKQEMANLFPTKAVYVATNENKEDHDNIHFIQGDLVSIMHKLQKEGLNIYLFGGGKVIDPFIKANCIDEYMIGIIPILLGTGRRLFLDHNPTIELSLKKYSIEDGVTVLHFHKR